MNRALTLLLLTVLALTASMGSRADSKPSQTGHVSVSSSFMHKGDSPAASVKVGRAVWSRRHAQRFLRAASPRTDAWAMTDVPTGRARGPRVLGRQPLPDPQVVFVDARHAFGLPVFFP